jgi:oxalate---CoA ligase
VFAPLLSGGLGGGPGAAATPDELHHFLGTQLAWFKVPRRITIMQDLPKGSTGKVQRRRLSESYR